MLQSVNTRNSVVLIKDSVRLFLTMWSAGVACSDLSIADSHRTVIADSQTVIRYRTVFCISSGTCMMYVTKCLTPKQRKVVLSTCTWCVALMEYSSRLFPHNGLANSHYKHVHCYPVVCN